MQQQAQAWGNSKGFDPNYHKRPRRAPALPSLQAGTQIHRDALVRHQVIAQLHRSFILVKTHDGFLLCFDQHAVDERIRLERLLRAVDAATAPTAAFAAASTAIIPASLPSSSNEAICRVSIKPLVLKRFSSEQLALLATPQCRAFLARFFFDYQLLRNHEALILRSIPRIVDAVPDVNEFLPWLLRDFQGMQRHQHQHQHQHQQHRHAGAPTDGSGDDGTVSGLFLPSALRDTLNSRACRYAIMFHTELSRARCKALLHQLATTCAFPFQCAHGRPSCVPLCRLDDYGDDGAGVIYDVDVQQRQTWRPMGQRDPPPIPLRFRRGVRTVHLRRFVRQEAQRQEAAAAMDGSGGL